MVAILHDSAGILNKAFLSGFPGGLVGKDLPANAGDTALIPGLGRSHMPGGD